uniref:Uncharacterized protein n=1 Tax=viral metagenome TaxID=1070528 RepID=A0A6C0J2G5_9ZZZZ
MNDHVYDTLFSNNTPQIEMWNDPHMDNDWDNDWDNYHSRERYIPRHLYAGNPKPWVMRLCSGPQTHEESNK